MDFYEFAIKLKTYLGEDKSEGEYVLGLFQNITDTSKFTPDNDPFVGKKSFSDETFRGYIKEGTHNDISRIAKKISGSLDRLKFDNYLNEFFSEDSKEYLIKEFKKECPNSTTMDITTKIAYLFADIIIKAANKKRKSPSKVTKKKIKAQSFDPNDSNVERDTYLLNECNFRCPICGEQLLVYKNKIPLKKYKVVPIYPETNNLLFFEEFSNIEPPKDKEDPDNLIALCSNHAEEYLQYPNIEQYKKLLHIRKQQIKNRNFENFTSTLQIESGLKEILIKIGSITERPAGARDTKWDAFLVDEKITSDYHLNGEVTHAVLENYFFVEDLIKNLDGLDGFSYGRLRAQISSYYAYCEAEEYSQQEAYDHMANWIEKKFNYSNQTVIKILISFFIQHCEVFKVETSE